METSKRDSSEKLSGKAVLVFNDAHNANEFVVRRIISAARSSNVVYVVCRVPVSIIKKKLGKKVAKGKIKYIDATETTVAGDDPDIRSVSNPQQLTEISVIIGMMLGEFKKPTTIMIDSITSMSDYVEPDELLIRFLHFNINRAKEAGARIELFADRDNKDTAFIRKLKQYCDEIIQ